MSTTEFNKDVRSWTSNTRRRMRNEVLRMVLNVGPGYEQMKAGTKSYAGEVNRIQFSFPYYMVYVHKGAGRGYGGNGFQKGKSIISEFTRGDGSKGKTNPLSVGRMGTGRRIPKPWFNPVLESELSKLDNLMISHKGVQAIENIQDALYRRGKID